MTTTDTQRGADGAGRVYSLMVCRVCGADSLDEVCPECRQPFSSPYGNGCAICDGFGGMTANGTWTICPNCSKWDMGGQHYRNINNRSVIMVDPEKFVAGVRRIRDLTEQRDALVARVEAAERVIAAAQEAVVHGDIYRRALANELRRIAPDEPLQIDPGFAVRAGASAERFRMRLATLATLARDETAEE
jgi:hypothetical protein